MVYTIRQFLKQIKYVDVGNASCVATGGCQNECRAMCGSAKRSDIFYVFDKKIQANIVEKNKQCLIIS